MFVAKDIYKLSRKLAACSRAASRNTAMITSDHGVGRLGQPTVHTITRSRYNGPPERPPERTGPHGISERNLANLHVFTNCWYTVPGLT